MTDKSLFKAFLKGKINDKKSLEQYLDELLKKIDAANNENLKEALNELYLAITKYQNSENFRELIENKLNALDIALPNLNYEEIYSKMTDSISFNSVDTRAINVMRENFYWVKSEYNAKVSDSLKNIIDKVFNGEIKRTEVADVLREEFRGVLSANRGYFEGVADHIISQMQNIARINQASEHEAPYYKVVARLDNRTSDICRSMHGRVIPAAHIERQAKKITSAKNIGDKKAAATWQNAPFLASNSKLPGNFGIPPYHFRCRTQLLPVWIKESEVDGEKTRSTISPSTGEIFRHIDSFGFEVFGKEDIYTHSRGDELKPTPAEIIKSLKKIDEIGWQHNNRRIARSGNKIVIFENDKVWTAFKRSSAQSAKEYFYKRVKNAKI